MLGVGYLRFHGRRKESEEGRVYPSDGFYHVSSTRKDTKWQTPKARSLEADVDGRRIRRHKSRNRLRRDRALVSRPGMELK